MDVTNDNMPLFPEERLKKIIQLLIEEKKVYVNDLTSRLMVSQSSIRNDLKELQSRGLIKRAHGGAILADGIDKQVLLDNSTLQSRTITKLKEKEAIGKAAVQLISDNDTIMIDGGSTNSNVARFLNGKRALKVITNATSLLTDLLLIPSVEIYLTGGLLDQRYFQLLGEVTVENLSKFQTNKAIIGVDGISIKGGLSATDYQVAMIKRKIIDCSEQIIVVGDHSKIDKICLMPIASLSEITYFVTDSGITPAQADAIRNAGPQVIIADVDD